ncbi:MAG: hypothetical protein RIG27_03675 [Coleofasciculus sp. F4-SAH-05]
MASAIVNSSAQSALLNVISPALASEYPAIDAENRLVLAVLESVLR